MWPIRLDTSISDPIDDDTLISYTRGEDMHGLTGEDILVDRVASLRPNVRGLT
jgi:hypothetical protein